jgi:hypothetical protein
LLEISPSSEWCQRWGAREHSWRHRSEGGFNPGDYSVAPLADTLAKAYVTSNHYSQSYPAAKFRYGIFNGVGELTGVAVFGVPMRAAVLTNTFPDLEPMVESIELSRLVLADEVPANAESWFLARCFESLTALGVRGVIAFADPVPREVGGALLFPGHVGIIYQASNSVYCGRATARTLTILPNGRVLSDRSAQKIRAQEQGHEHVERLLVAMGATAPRAGAGGAEWLATALADVGTVRLRHRGNHRYAFALGNPAARRQVRILGGPGAYPKGLG